MTWRKKIQVGTSGYAYPGWVGPFYPEEMRRQEMLPYYAERFGTIELNFTYYGIPRPAVLARMVRETPSSFNFFVKAHRGITHEGEAARYLSPFLRCLEPVLDEDRLAGVLLQFPQSFHNTPRTRQYLKSLLAALGGLSLVVEVRHACWLRKDFFDFLSARGVAYCCVDEPRIAGLIPPIPVATSPVGYVRLHGRNGRNWYSGHQRYDYSYSREELLEWLPKLRKLAGMAGSVYVFFNNCHGAQAVENALLLRKLLQQEHTPTVHPTQAILFP